MTFRMEYRFGRYGVVGYGGFLVDSDFEADFPLVGSRLRQTSALCNVFSRVKGCLNHEAHFGRVLPEGVSGAVGLDGKIGVKMGVVFPRAYHCSDPTCPVCCFDWARRTARRAMDIFEVYDDLLVDCEIRHVTVSVPRFDWGKSFKWLRGYVSKLLVALGVEGGQLIYHPKRWSKYRECWYFSPHFHVLGYIEGGLFDGGLIRDFHNASGYVVVNLERRKSVLGTLLYQLSHAGVPEGHVHAVTWFGCCSSRASIRLGVRDVIVANRRYAIEKRNECPICGSKMRHVCRYSGNFDVPDFDYEKYNEKFVVDYVYNWFVVPHRVRRKKSDNDDFDDV